MTSTTSQGTKFGISAAAPATYDATGFAALTFTMVKGIESIPPFGPSTATNTFQPLDGDEEKHKGPTTNGGLDLNFAYDGADAGQTLLRTAAQPSNNAEYSGVVILPNGDKSFFRGRAFGAQLNPGSATNVLMQSTRFEINTRPVAVLAS